MNCPSCDVNNPEGSTHCSECGVPLPVSNSSNNVNEGSNISIPPKPEGMSDEEYDYRVKEYIKANTSDSKDSDVISKETREPKNNNSKVFFISGFVLASVLFVCLAVLILKYTDIVDLGMSSNSEDITEAEVVQTVISNEVSVPTIEDEIIISESEEEITDVEEDIVTEESTSVSLGDLEVTEQVNSSGDLLLATDLVAMLSLSNRVDMLKDYYMTAGKEIDLGRYTVTSSDLGISEYSNELGIEDGVNTGIFGCVSLTITNTTESDIPYSDVGVYLLTENLDSVGLFDVTVVEGTTTSSGVFLQNLGSTLSSGECVNLLIPYSSSYTNGIYAVAVLDYSDNGNAAIILN